MPLALELFLAFAKVGFCSFGGFSMIPVIYDEMVTAGYMTASEFADIIAIAEMTPGSFAVNVATFVGIRTGGLLCGMLATCGNMVPSLTLCLLAAAFIQKFRNNYWLQSALAGVRPVCVGLLAATTLQLFQENYVVEGVLSLKCLVIGLVTGYLLLGRKWGTVKVIAVAAALGAILPAF